MKCGWVHSSYKNCKSALSFFVKGLSVVSSLWHQVAITSWPPAEATFNCLSLRSRCRGHKQQTYLMTKSGFCTYYFISSITVSNRVVLEKEGCLYSLQKPPKGCLPLDMEAVCIPGLSTRDISWTYFSLSGMCSPDSQAHTKSNFPSSWLILRASITLKLAFWIPLLRANSLALRTWFGDKVMPA